MHNQQQKHNENSKLRNEQKQKLVKSTKEVTIRLDYNQHINTQQHSMVTRNLANLQILQLDNNEPKLLRELRTQHSNSNTLQTATQLISSSLPRQFKLSKHLQNKTKENTKQREKENGTPIFDEQDRSKQKLRKATAN